MCIFMDKFIKQTYIDDLVPHAQVLIKTFLAGANDMNGDVRDQALNLMGTIVGRLKVTANEKTLNDV